MPEQPRFSLEVVPERVLHALAAGDPTALAFPRVSPYLAGAECVGLWRMRSAQIAETPADAPWITRFIVVPTSTVAAGLAGFHGQPDERGMVEVGYRVDPEHRRKGYARRSLETLLTIAQGHSDVSVVRATISPDNTASRALIDGYGFVAVGEQWDDEDGLELIYEVAVSGV